MQERRATERLRINLNARWEALKTEGRGAVCDLSSMGCFVLTTAEVKPGELIRLEISFPEELASLWVRWFTQSRKWGLRCALRSVRKLTSTRWFNCARA